MVAVNDPFMDLDYMQYLLKYDSVHKRFKGTVTTKKAQFFLADSKFLPLFLLLNHVCGATPRPMISCSGGHRGVFGREWDEGQSFSWEGSGSDPLGFRERHVCLRIHWRFLRQGQGSGKKKWCEIGGLMVPWYLIFFWDFRLWLLQLKVFLNDQPFSSFWQFSMKPSRLMPCLHTGKGIKTLAGRMQEGHHLCSTQGPSTLVFLGCGWGWLVGMRSTKGLQNHGLVGCWWGKLRCLRTTLRCLWWEWTRRSTPRTDARPLDTPA